MLPALRSCCGCKSTVKKRSSGYAQQFRVNKVLDSTPVPTVAPLTSPGRDSTFRKSSWIAESGMAERLGGAPRTRVLDREAREEDAEPMISSEVDDEASPESDADRTNEEEHAVRENALVVNAPESTQDAPRWFRSEPGTYAAMCNACFKWRKIPSKELYEAIGEHILERPFVCAHAQQWRDNMSCDVPADLEDNDPNVLWVLDNHNIPRSPTGFERQTVVRTDNPRRQFADIYYKAPCGKTLNSMVQVQKYLDQHPELGVQLSQFSFKTPKGRAPPRLQR